MKESAVILEIEPQEEQRGTVFVVRYSDGSVQRQGPYSDAQETRWRYDALVKEAEGRGAAVVLDGTARVQ